MDKKRVAGLLGLLLLGLWTITATAQTRSIQTREQIVSPTILIQPGDSWAALAMRFQVDEAALRQLNPQFNAQRQPTIGRTFVLPETAVSQSGTLVRPKNSLLQTAVQHNTPLWQIALSNQRNSPYSPTLYQPILLPDATATPHDLPAGFSSLELSQTVGTPGQAVGFRAETAAELPFTAVLGDDEIDLFRNGRFAVGLTGTGAFFGTQQPSLTIQVSDAPLWEQPWQFSDPNSWEYQQITLTGTAAQIDQQSIAEERERLFAIWQESGDVPQWHNPFQLPITSYLEISSPFGARRSYNGGPYRSYHEGVDFAAYGGTAVTAPASGTVVIAELLYVRGNAVIIDHGLGIYSGFYHMSSLSVAPGDVVEQGQRIGEVGTTGLSTGNHLHWDLLVNGVWVDGQAWLAQDMACWILEGLGQSCGEANLRQ